MEPVDVLKESPAGSEPLVMLHEVAAPPVLLGVMVLMAVFFVNDVRAAVTMSVLHPQQWADARAVAARWLDGGDCTVDGVGVPVMAPVDELTEARWGNAHNAPRDGGLMICGRDVLMAVFFVNVTGRHANVGASSRADARAVAAPEFEAWMVSEAVL